MMNLLLDRFSALELSAESVSLLTLGVALGIGGVLSLYVQFLYNRCCSSVSNREAISGVFPLLTLVTIAVIAVVKSSLALSLGLVGALSIVRFRAAIKDPEELVYLFFCIALGLALGAEHFAYAVMLVFVASTFILGRRFLGRGLRRYNLLLTVTGDAEQYFDSPESGAIATLKALVDSVSIQRYEVNEGRGLIRVVVPKSSTDETIALIAALRKDLPECEISYVNMDTIL